MPADYSDRPTVSARVQEQLCDLLVGNATTAVGLAPELLQLARAERVEPLAIWRMGAEAPGARNEMRALAVSEEIRRAELAEVLARMNAVPGAQPIVFKGAALAYSHYPEPWLRPRVDTDILVAPDVASQVLVVLERAGYTRETATSGALVTAQASLERTDRFGITHVIDLHWEIANRTVIAGVLSHAEISSHALPAPAIGPDARVPSNADALLIACLHRAAHHRDSEELLWLYDIHLLANGLSGIEWDVVVSIAERRAVTALIARGLDLATSRFHTRIPPTILPRLATARGEPSAIYLSKGVRRVDWLLADLRGLPWRKRGRLLFEHVVPPAAYVREKYGVRSRPQLVLAYLRRAVGGAPKWFLKGSRW